MRRTRTKILVLAVACMLIASSALAGQSQFTLRDGFINMVKEIVASGSDVNSKYGGEPLLFIAIYYDAPETVKLLIDNGAHIDIQNELGGTPLISAITMNNFTIFKLLLDNGADVNYPKCPKTESSKIYNTPLEVATMFERKKMIELLKFKGATSCIYPTWECYTKCANNFKECWETRNLLQDKNFQKCRDDLGRCNESCR